MSGLGKRLLVLEKLASIPFILDRGLETPLASAHESFTRKFPVNFSAASSFPLAPFPLDQPPSRYRTYSFPTLPNCWQLAISQEKKTVARHLPRLTIKCCHFVCKYLPGKTWWCLAIRRCVQMWAKILRKCTLLLHKSVFTSLVCKKEGALHFWRLCI